MRGTGSPGRRSMVSITTNTTPSSTGTARRRRRRMNVSIRRLRRSRLLVDPGLRQRQVVLDGMDLESLDVGPRDDDLLRRVDRDPHHLLDEDVLHLAIELLALRLVEAPAGLLDQRVDLRVDVARGVPARGRHLLAVEE